MPKPPDAARLCALFDALPDGSIVWRARAASDFESIGMTPDGAARAALDWTANKAGRAPHWRAAGDALTCRADRRQVLLQDVAQALGIDPDLAEAQARAAMQDQAQDRAKALILRLCALDKSGAIVWAERTAETSPKTPAKTRDLWNKAWAGKRVSIRAGKLRVQRQEIDAGLALLWLQE